MSKPKTKIDEVMNGEYPSDSEIAEKDRFLIHKRILN